MYHHISSIKLQFRKKQIIRLIDTVKEKMKTKLITECFNDAN